VPSCQVDWLADVESAANAVGAIVPASKSSAEVSLLGMRRLL